MIIKNGEMFQITTLGSLVYVDDIKILLHHE